MARRVVGDGHDGRLEPFVEIVGGAPDRGLLFGNRKFFCKKLQFGLVVRSLDAGSRRIAARTSGNSYNKRPHLTTICFRHTAPVRKLLLLLLAPLSHPILYASHVHRSTVHTYNAFRQESTPERKKSGRLGDGRK